MGYPSQPLTKERIEQNVVRVPESGCWIWDGAVSSSGYGKLRSKYTQHTAHKVSYEVFKGPIQPGKYVCHHCDVRACVNPEHLFLGSPKENQQDMAKKMRHAYGDKNGNSKLSEDQAKSILSMRNSGKTKTSVGDAFGVSRVAVAKIWSGALWPHLQKEAVCI